jgi:predicted RNA methylase
MTIDFNSFSDEFLDVINKIRKGGEDPFNITILLREIQESKIKISRNEILEFIISNKRLGYHSTPNDLAEFMSEIGRLYNPQSVIDISCGLANTLAYIDYSDDLTGVEINSEIISLTKFLLPDLNLILADSLKYEFKKKYDLVISNFPYGMDITEAGRRFPIDSLFVKKAIGILKPGGTLVCILPDVFLKMKIYEKTREEIIKNFSLEMVIQLPLSIIQNSYIIPAIVVIKKEKQREKVFLTDFTEKEKIIENYLEKKGKLWIPNANLNNNWDPQYHAPEKKSILDDFENINSKPLSEMAEVYLGCSIYSKNLKPSGEILYLRSNNIIKGQLSINSDNKFLFLKDIPLGFNNVIIKQGDILVSRIFQDEPKVYIYKSTDPPSIASNSIYILRSFNSDYLASYLNTEKGNIVLREQIRKETSGHFAPVISIEGLKSIRIPIIPLENLNQLGDGFINIAEEDKLLELKEELKTLIKEIQGQKKQNSDTSAKLDLMSNRFDVIDTRLNVLAEKLDSILLAIKSLSSDFKEVKLLNRDEEEIINRLYVLIDEKIGLISTETEKKFEFYVKEIKCWLDRWDDLEFGSKQFVPQAEFLYDQLAKIQDADYSPFIVQYSRALENEILIKLFQAYHQYLISSNIDRIELIKSDLENSNTNKFARFIKVNNTAYTLGDMNFIMKLMKEGGNTLAGSRLLKDFKSFSGRYFQTNVFEKEFLDKVSLIIEKYRNKAAHPNILSGEIAREFHLLIKDCLVDFLGKYKFKI